MRQDYVHCHSKWHSIKTDAIFSRLESDPEIGLATAEAGERLAEFGLNQLPARKRVSPLIRFLKHFHDILIYILFLAAFITLVLGHYADTVVIVLVAVVNAAIGYFQEHKAEKALDDIREMLSPKATVLRDGSRKEIDSDELTLGDIVLLSPGDKVPADLRLFQASSLKVEESMLTGEAVPSDKHSAAVDLDAPLGDRENMAFSGTSVSAGTGRGIVIAVGLETEIGHISQMLDEVPAITTPLIRQMGALGRSVAIIIMIIAAAVYLFGHFFRDYAPSELLLSTIGLAIAAIPEGLPAILSIILAIGVQNMAKRRAIVRNLPSVETLGSVSVICSDKTGTLTKNEMTVKEVAIRAGDFAVSGSGYAPEGIIAPETAADSGEKTPLSADAIRSIPDLKEILECFTLCNDAALRKDAATGAWGIQGDPTEGALLTLYEKSRLGTSEDERLADLPFDSEYKYMAVLVQTDHGKVIYIKGAPDRLLDMAESERLNGASRPLDRDYWEEELTTLAARGRRMLGAAVKPVSDSVTSIGHEDLKDGVIFLGFAAIVDPPRDEVMDAVKACHAAGIRVKMITGDHADTAKAIGRELGIGDGSLAVTGRELDEMTPEQFIKAVCKYDIFARTSPEHKLRLVEALQTNGAICAMTGDGVNDAPALRKADVGVAMGIKGTEVTKDSAEIVLADDNFSTIVSAVEEGRRVYDNLKKTILFILPTNGAESFLIIASILFGTLIPLTPVQILWVNMVTSVTVSLALAFEQVEPGAMARPPRPASEKLLSGYFLWRIFFVSVLIGGLTLIMNQMLLASGHDIATVRTVTLLAIAMCQMFHLFNSRSIRGSAFRMDFFSNRAVLVVCGLMLVLQALATYAPFMNRILGTVPLGPSYWLMTIALSIIVFLAVEGEKWMMRRLDARSAGNGETLRDNGCGVNAKQG